MTKNLTPSFKIKLVSVLQEVNDKYYGINAGGCGAFAKILSDILEPKGFNIQYVLVSRSKDTISNINKNVSNINDDAIKEIIDETWEHVMLLIDDQLIDSTGIYKSLLERATYENYLVSTPIPKECFEILTSEKYASMWTKRFNRDLIPYIAKEMHQLLN